MPSIACRVGASPPLASARSPIETASAIRPEDAADSAWRTAAAVLSSNAEAVVMQCF